MYELEEADCFIYAEPVSSVMYISLKQGYFWDTIDGAKFRVSTYNGGGWDSDSSGSSWLYVKFDELVGDSWNPSVQIATSSTGISAPDRLFTLGHPAVSGGVNTKPWLDLLEPVA